MLGQQHWSFSMTWTQRAGTLNEQWKKIRATQNTIRFLFFARATQHLWKEGAHQSTFEHVCDGETWGPINAGGGRIRTPKFRHPRGVCVFSVKNILNAGRAAGRLYGHFCTFSLSHTHNGVQAVFKRTPASRGKQQYFV